MEIAQAVLISVLGQIKKDIKELAKIYDTRDLFGIAYEKFADKIIEIAINKHLE